MSPASAAAFDLDTPYPLTREQVTRFRSDGFIKLKGVFTADALNYFGAEITRLTFELNPRKDTPLEQQSTYERAFIQVFNLWNRSEVARQFSFSKRLARIATELMGTTGVRMYHDQALYKEPSGGFTPWHVDQQYWPMATGKSITAWVPLQAVPLEMGPLSFGKGSHRKNIGRDLPISDESEQIIRDQVRQQGLVEVTEPFELGEVSFHAGWTLHRAGPNTTSEARKVHTVIYMDEDMRLIEPKSDFHRTDWKACSPSTAVGQVMADPLNPVLYHAD